MQLLKKNYWQSCLDVKDTTNIFMGIRHSLKVKSIMKEPLARLQRMLLCLQKYDFQLSYKSGSNMVLADALSRASLKDADPEISDEELAAQIHM